MNIIDGSSRLGGLAQLAGNYRGILCDVWGVVHNGVAPWEGAVDALTRFRRDFGSVVLLTNAPRPRDRVQAQLDGLGVPREAYDEIVTSGDAARAIRFCDGPIRTGRSPRFKAHSPGSESTGGQGSQPSRPATTFVVDTGRRVGRIHGMQPGELISHPGHRRPFPGLTRCLRICTGRAH